MTGGGDMERRYAALAAAFAADGFRVARHAYTETGRLGLMARHISASNYDTGEKKAAYYLEGTAYERGYLMGLLAEPQIADMAVNFAENIVFDQIGLDFLNRFALLKKMLVELVYELTQSAWQALPAHVHDEAAGMLDGCRRSNRNTQVTMRRLITLNAGVDTLLALVYTGGMLREHVPRLTAEDIRLKLMCNAFTALGPAASGGHYFARDFMFASGEVLQNNVAHIIHKPEGRASERGFAHVNVTAPGIIGSFSVMNERGVAGGINLSPAANCDPQRAGMNSLLLLRDCVMKGGSAREAASVILRTRRGVPWNYVLSDGGTDTACTVEAGASWAHTDYMSYPPPQIRPYLPGAAFLERYPYAPIKDGVAIRWYGEPVPQEYLHFNPGLWQIWNATNAPRITLHPDALEPDGFINRTPYEKNCPSTQYFPPERPLPGVFLTSNHFLTPAMRMCSMDGWVAAVTRGHANDIQWRYDALREQLRKTLQREGTIGFKSAKQLADFLAPYGAYPEYYRDKPRSRDGRALRVEGCVSVFDLKAKVVESHYGYFTDEWVRTTLPTYL
ncbi:MAG: hypothetical protein ACOX8N_01330 [Christensenellales bacterium]|jgi:hypothetical protein